MGKLARVVAVAAANDDDVVAMANQVVHGGLALLGGMADRVDETHLRAAMKAFDRLNQPQRVFNGLRGLRDDAELAMRRNLREVGFLEHDDGLGKVANKTANFDVLALADDDGQVTIADERGEGVVRFFDQRAGGVDDGVTGVLPRLAVFVGGPVGGDSDLVRRGGLEVVEIAALSADCDEMAIDERIVNELAEDGQRGALRGAVGGAQGVADAEAHAVMLSEDDVHGVVGFVGQSEWVERR